MRPRARGPLQPATTPRYVQTRPRCTVHASAGPRGPRPSSGLEPYPHPSCSPGKPKHSYCTARGLQLAPDILHSPPPNPGTKSLKLPNKRSSGILWFSPQSTLVDPVPDDRWGHTPGFAGWDLRAAAPFSLAAAGEASSF